MNELDELIRRYLQEKSAEILKIEVSEVEWEDELDEYGFDSMEVNKLCLDVNAKFGLEIRPVIFLEYPSLSEFSEYLKEKHYAAIEGVLL